jgi:hypothetical protein
MRPLKGILLAVSIISITWLVAGCGGSPSAPVSEAPAAQATSIPPTTAPPSPTHQSGPKAGLWEGDKPKVSFEVSSDGKIRNFTMEAPIGGGTCNIKAEKEIPIEANGTFLFVQSIEANKIDKNLLGLAQAMGNAPEVTKTPSGDMIDLQRIEGKFDSDTTLTGSFKLHACGDNFTFSSEPSSPWKAAWKSS